ncbi:STT3 domain-containing protein [Hydrogenimonas sp.]
MAVAYLFSIAVRMIWIDWASEIPEFYWNGQIMINTNDGYYFASAAQKELFGTLQHNPRVPDLWMTATITLTYFAAKFLPFSLDTIILYMPGIVSSLVVIPLILIGRLYGMTWTGFFAALLASVTWSYYNRTMFGYYDTDMFSAMAPMFIVYFLMAANHRRSIGYALAASIVLALYPYLYNQGKAMVFAISALYMAYVWWRHRDEPFAYPSIILVSVALLPIFWPIKLLLLPLMYLGLRRIQIAASTLMYIALGMAFLAFLAGDGFNFIYTKLMRYAQREEAITGLHFYNVVNTIREAGHIPFDLLAKRISGSVPAFILAIIGYCLLLWRQRAFLITLPLMGLGLFAWWGGLRFTVYAVPIAAFGLVYLFHQIASFTKKAKIQYALVTLFSATALFPNIAHVIDYKVPTVFKAPEASLLDKLKQIGNDKDYVVAWWDYGYPIWYYANKNTLIDGAKHQNDNFLISEILTTGSQLEAARLSRIAVETYVASDYKTVANTLFKNGQPDQIDPNQYLAELKKAKTSILIPPKTREVFIYLPYRMQSIFPTVKVFSNIDLKTGERKRSPLFLATTARKNTKDTIFFANGAKLDKSKGVLHLGQQRVPIHAFIVAEVLQNGNTKVHRQSLYPSSTVSILYAKSYGQFIILDNEMLDSLYVKLFFLDQYDPTLFEKIISSPWAKVFKIKL